MTGGPTHEGNGNTPAPEPESFQPDVVITPDAVSFFSLSFRRIELDSGALVDVSETAREAGFVWPVAVSAAIWKAIQTIPAAYSHEDVTGRLYDVLYMAHRAVRQARIDGSELLYNLVLHTQDTKELYTVRLVAEPGDDGQPVITLSSAEQDKNVAMGEIVLTEGALSAFVEAQASPAPFLLRHQRGDWGNLDSEDWATNDRAIIEGTRLVSAYTLPGTGQPIWIITEWDRSVTTVLLPSEY